MSALMLFGSVPYLVPTIIGAYRDHPRKTAILVVNLVLGWTIVGWIVALAWACSGPGARQEIATAGDEAGPGGLKLEGRDPRIDIYGNPKR